MSKTEKVGYLKSSFNLQQGTLTLDGSRLKLEAHQTGVGGLGLLGALLKPAAENNNVIFDVPLSELTITQGRHGVQKNVLEVTDQAGKTYRLIVQSYQEWAAALQ